MKAAGWKPFYFEVPVLSIINQVYFEDKKTDEALILENIQNKMDLVLEDQKYKMERTPFVFFEFGTRRRFSRIVQGMVIKSLTESMPLNFRGTGNVLFAQKYNLVPIGTMAHEFIQAFQAVVREEASQKTAFQTWSEIYRAPISFYGILTFILQNSWTGYGRILETRLNSAIKSSVITGI